MKNRSKRSIIWLMSEEDFRRLIAESTSFSDAVERAGFAVKRTGGSPYDLIKKRCALLAVDTTHFVRRPPGIGKLPLAEILTKNSTKTGTQARKAFLELNSVPYVCSECEQLPVWQDLPLIMILDHKDGDNRNHDPLNLRWLCPNCNNQTDTFCGRNRQKKSLATSG